jgi:hypothetical protein
MVDIGTNFHQDRVMRLVAGLGLLFLLTACSGDPRSYGITGPGAEPAPIVAPAGAEATPVPGVATTGTPYGPSSGATTGISGFFGYN